MLPLTTELDPRPIVDAGVEYWDSLKFEGDDIPQWSSFDPSQIRPLLSHIVLMEVGYEPLDFKYRIIGETVLLHFWRNYTGLWLSEIDHQSENSMLYSVLQQAVVERQAIYGKTPYVGPKQDFRQSREVVLPMADPEGRVVRLLVFLEFPRKSIEPPPPPSGEDIG